MKKCDEMDWAFFECVVLASILLIVLWLAPFVKIELERNNIEYIKEPEVTTTTYYILGGNDTTSVSGFNRGGLSSVRGAVTENWSYKIYYSETNEDGKKIAVPLEINERDVEIILEENLEQDYLVAICEQYYRIDHNEEPATKEVYKSKTSYELYIDQERFSNRMVIDGSK